MLHAYLFASPSICLSISRSIAIRNSTTFGQVTIMILTLIFSYFMPCHAMPRHYLILFPLLLLLLLTMIWSKDQSIQAHFEYLKLWIYAALFNHIYVHIQYSNSHSSDLADRYCWHCCYCYCFYFLLTRPDPTRPFHSIPFLNIFTLFPSLSESYSTW